MKKPFWKRPVAIILAVVMFGSICYSAWAGIGTLQQRKNNQDNPSNQTVITMIVTPTPGATTKTELQVDEESMKLLEEMITLTENGEYEKAMEHFQTLESKYSKENLLYFYRGNIYLYQEEYETALTDYLTAIKGHEDVVEINTFIGLCYAGMGDDSSAAPYLEKGLASEEVDESVYQQCVVSYQNAKQYEKAMEIAEKYLALFPENSTPYTYIGNIFLLQENNEKAIFYYEKAVELEKDEEQLAALRLNLGECYLITEQYEACIPYYEEYLKSVKEDPEGDTSVIHLHLGLAYMSLDRYQDALGEFGQCSKESEEYSEALLEMGLCSYMLDDYAKTVEYLVQYYDLDIEDHNFDAKVYLGIALYEENRYEDAEQAFRASLDVEGMKETCLYYLGSIDIFKEDYRQAVVDYTELIPLGFETETAFYNRGVAYLNLEENEKAKADFSSVVESGQKEELVENAQKVLEQFKALEESTNDKN